MLDMHNVVGVMTLPFTLMYAISGLVFNLAIVYQIAFAFILYQGDREALVNDAGYSTFSAPEQSGVALDMSASIGLVETTAEKYGDQPILLRFYNYGDENAVLEVLGRDSDHFSQIYRIFYQVKDGSIVQQVTHENSNAFRQGRSVLSTLHFGDFAGFDLRVLYFILGIAVAGMIAVGNILWINKRATQNSVSEKATRFVGSLTVGACSGFVVATAIAFFAERVMPASWINRADILEGTYNLALLCVILGAYQVSRKKVYMAHMLRITAGVLAATVLTDWLMFSDVIPELWKNGDATLVNVELGLLLFGGFCLWVGQLLLRKPDYASESSRPEGVREAIAISR